MIQAVIFDFDGTLVDSEPAYREVDSRFLLEKGVLLSDEEWDKAIGMGGGPFFAYIKERHGVAGSVADLVAEKDDLYLAHAPASVQPFPKALELARYLYVHGVPVGIATSSRRRVLDAMLDATGIGWLFDATVASDDVRRSKPAPDAFLLAAQRLRVDPADCLVLEDSVYGVEAARSAGMTVVALPHPGMEGRTGYERADAIVHGGAAKIDVDQLIASYGLAGDAGDEALQRLRDVVWKRHESARRPMPWRTTHDPYHILVSEFMLQQTQVSRVEPKYSEFLASFPTVQALANAELSEVLSHWQGLGYNRRGKNLRDAALEIVDRFEGSVPRRLEDLVSLPGVGAYTASAVVAFAFEEPVVVLETNIRRVVLHYLFQGADNVADAEVVEVIERLITEPVREWYYALMDYGSHLGSTLRNANRRSRQYKVQSPFAGSVREVRGKILRAVTQRSSLTLNELEQAVGPTDSRYAPALEALEREGLIVVEGDLVRIR